MTTSIHAMNTCTKFSANGQQKTWDEIKADV